MSKPYCGVNDPPKGRTRGTAEQCAKSGQIRYYGLEKVDKETIAKPKAKAKATPETNMEKVERQYQ